MKKRIIVGASGASGAPLTIEVLKLLRAAGCETHLIVTEGALLTLRQETELTEEALYDLADHCYSPRDIGAAPRQRQFSHRRDDRGALQHENPGGHPKRVL